MLDEKALQVRRRRDLGKDKQREAGRLLISLIKWARALGHRLGVEHIFIWPVSGGGGCEARLGSLWRCQLERAVSEQELLWVAVNCQVSGVVPFPVMLLFPAAGLVGAAA